MTKHHRGNVGLLHNTLQNMLVDILEDRNPKARIYKEHPVPSKLEFGKSWVVDVADLSHPRFPTYYEIDTKSTASTRKKVEALKHHTGFDLVVITIDSMKRELGKNPGILDIKKWLEERVV